MNKDNNLSSGIGGMASSHLPDTAAAASTQKAPPPHNAPLLSVLRRDPNGHTPTLQFESNSGLLDELEDSDDDLPRSGEKRSGRRKIKIEYIEDKSRRHITFSKRKAGIMKKAYELSTLTGTQVLLLVASETGHVYTFATPKLQPLITKQEGKNLIQACLNSPDSHHPSHPAIPEYHPSGTSYDVGDLNEEDLLPRSNSTGNIAQGPPQLHSYMPGGTTPTPPAGTSAAAAAAQVFMNSGHAAQYNQQQSAAYWNQNAAAAAAGMYAPIPAKSNQAQQQQQQQSQQQQMYHALLQQQQLYQQFHNQQQTQQQQQQQKHNESGDA